MTEKIDALDLIINCLREHEEALDESLETLRELVGDLTQIALQFQKLSLYLLKLLLEPIASKPEVPQWIKDLLEQSILEKAMGVKP